MLKPQFIKGYQIVPVTWFLVSVRNGEVIEMSTDIHVYSYERVIILCDLIQVRIRLHGACVGRRRLCD